ncbi:MAG: hypothetical protein K2X01_07815 [Cyanobacteria bacterium]|nr:hypothetical protein [Cyanobacteriota bacterium]
MNKRYWILSVLVLAWCLLMPGLSATDLPQAVLQYVQTKDGKAQIRFDGLITFSNGETYLPVIPQDTTQAPPSQVVSVDPLKSEYPDIIEFDHHYFLIRLVQSAAGKLTIAYRETYPIALKEGILPQDLLLPPNLFIPIELKILLGDLPYNPRQTNPDQANPEKGKPTSTSLKPQAANTPDPIDFGDPKPVGIASLIQAPPNVLFATPWATPRQRAYLTNINKQTLVVFDIERERKRDEIPLRCVPSSLATAHDGSKLFVSCLSNDEVVVIDTQTNAIKTRLAVGSKPTKMLSLTGNGVLLVTNRYSDNVFWVDTDHLTVGAPVKLPENGRGGLMAPSSVEQGLVYVTDDSLAKVYLLPLKSQQITRTIDGLPNAIAITEYQPTPDAPAEMWLVSQSKHQVGVFDVLSGQVIQLIDVGKKPVSAIRIRDQLFVLSATQDQLDVIDMKQRQLIKTIALENGCFPTEMTVSYSGNGQDKLWITTAGNDSLIVVDVATLQVQKTLSVEIHSNGIALIGGEQVPLASPSNANNSETYLPPIIPAITPASQTSSPENVGPVLSQKTVTETAAPPPKTGFWSKTLSKINPIKTKIQENRPSVKPESPETPKATELPVSNPTGP